MVYFAQVSLGRFRLFPGFSEKSDRDLIFIKIGKSVCPPTRVKYLAMEYGKPMTLLATMPGDREEERMIHQRFAHIRLPATKTTQPEWFYPVPELMDFIKNLSTGS